MNLTAVELGKKIKAGEVTVREAVAAVYDQIDAVERDVNSYVTLDREAAERQADEVQKKIDAGELTGPLAGVPVAIKDNMCTKGMLTTCSSKICSDLHSRSGFQSGKSRSCHHRKDEYGRICHGKHDRNFLLWCDEKPLESGSCAGRFFRRILCGSCGK
jgi:hypothetical protein